MTKINDAAGAYANALSRMGQDSAQKVTDQGVFGGMVKDALQSAITAQHTSEKMSGAALAGKADMTDVLQAITDAEVALNTVLAVRDKVVQAYEQVMRTPI